MFGRLSIHAVSLQIVNILHAFMMNKMYATKIV